MLLIIKQQSHFRFRSGVALLLLSHDRYAILDLSKNLHGDEKMQRKKEIVTALILTALMTFIEMSALPMALFCNIEFKDIIKNITLKDLIKRNSIINEQYKFKQRGKIEKKIIKNSTFIVK